MVLSTHSQTHLRRTFCRVGQTPRRALRVTQSIVGKLSDERLSRRGTRPLSAGRLWPAAVRAGARNFGTRIHVETMLDGESCPQAADRVKRSGRRGAGFTQTYW